MIKKCCSEIITHGGGLAHVLAIGRLKVIKQRNVVSRHKIMDLIANSTILKYNTCLHV